MTAARGSYKPGDDDVRAVLAEVLARGRTAADVGEWFAFGAGRRIVATDALIDHFLMALAVELRTIIEPRERYLLLRGFGSFSVARGEGRDGSGALAGRWLNGRRRVVFRPAPSSWKLDAGGD